MPLEYCDYSGMTDRCRKWAEANAPDALEGLSVKDGDDGDEKKHQKRGGKGSKVMKSAYSKNIFIGLGCS